MVQSMQISRSNKRKSLNHGVNGNLDAGNVLKSKPSPQGDGHFNGTLQ